MRIVIRLALPILIILLSLVTVLPILHNGFFPMHDDTQPTRVFEMAKSLSDGMFPVRWTQDLGFGYGYPIFNFYAPFPYYIGGIMHLLGFDALTATKIMMVLPAVIGGIGMYMFIASFLGSEAGFASAVIYLFFSYFAVNMYVRGAVGEYFAYGFLPYVLWGILKVYYQTKVKKVVETARWILLAAISLALVIISHNLSAFMLAFLLSFLLILSLIFHPQRKRLLVSYVLLFLLAFLLSAFYSLPALFEMGYTNVQSQVGGGANFHDHFVCLSQLWASPWGFGGSAKGCLDGLSFALGKSTIIFAVLGLALGIYLWLRKRLNGTRFLLLFGSLLGAVSLFMTTAYSAPVWNAIPFMGFLQYPWRFLDFAGVALAILCGFLVYGVRKVSNRFVGIGVLIFLTLATLFYNLKLFRPQFYESRTSAYYTSKQQIQYTISEISHEYMPKQFVLPVSANQLPKTEAVGIKNIASLVILVQKTGYLRLAVKSKTQGLVKLTIAPFPAWHILLDAHEASYRTTDSGLLVTVPQGTHIVVAQFRQTPLELVSDILSIAGIVGLITVIIYPRWKRKKA